MAKVLVTGASGFIGANLVRSLLYQGHEVHILLRDPGIRMRLEQLKNQLVRHYAELSDPASILNMVSHIEPDLVFHLAHYGGNSSENNTALIRKVIIDGTAGLFDACLKVGSAKAIVNAGSSSEYGAKAVPMKEDMPLEPNTYYGCAKVWATFYGQHLAREKGLPVITLRPFSVFGPWEASKRFIPKAILASLQGEGILRISDGNIVRDFIFVDDVVRAFIAAAGSDCFGQVFNIGYGEQMKLLEAVALIQKHLNKKIKIESGGECRSFDRANTMWQADISKAKDLLDWQPQVSREEGMRRTIEWFWQNLELYNV